MLWRLHGINAMRFLSTPSARRATAAFLRDKDAVPDFYPRPPRGGRPSIPEAGADLVDISIHALREEGDQKGRFPEPDARNFYPRPPRGGRLWRSGCPPRSRQYFYPRPPRGGRLDALTPRLVGHISIHALREEGDRRGHTHTEGADNFYPRPPRGGRRRQVCSIAGSSYFYPRPPRGGRQLVLLSAVGSLSISIHALREEGDWPESRRPARCTYFYPRPPRGGRRPTTPENRPPKCNFYPRPPRGGRPAAAPR